MGRGLTSAWGFSGLLFLNDYPQALPVMINLVKSLFIMDTDNNLISNIN